MSNTPQNKRRRDDKSRSESFDGLEPGPSNPPQSLEGERSQLTSPSGGLPPPLELYSTLYAPNQPSGSDERQRGKSSMVNSLIGSAPAPAQVRRIVLSEHYDDQDMTTRTSTSLGRVASSTVSSPMAISYVMNAYNSYPDPFGAGSGYGRAASEAQPSHTREMRSSVRNYSCSGTGESGESGHDDETVGGRGDEDEALEDFANRNGGSLKTLQLQRGHGALPSILLMPEASYSSNTQAEYAEFLVQGFTPINATPSDQWTSNQSYKSSDIRKSYLPSTGYGQSANPFSLHTDHGSSESDSKGTQKPPIYPDPLFPVRLLQTRVVNQESKEHILARNARKLLIESVY